MTAVQSIFASGKGGRGRQVLIAALVVLGLVVVVLAVRKPADDGIPLDPDSRGRLGAKALVLLLREGGADVAVSARPPPPDRRTAVILRDTFGDDRQTAILEWVKAGGVLLVADPGSDLAQAQVYISPVNGGIQTAEMRGGCESVPALRNVDQLSVEAFVVFRPPDDPAVRTCFQTDDGPFLVVTPIGRGTVVAVGGAGPFINDRLDEQDNAVLADAVLSPVGNERIVFLTDYADDAAPEDAIESEGSSVFDLLPRGVRWALVQLGVVFAIAALWRARRLGKPVPDAQPVELPGSELVVAVGELLRKGRHRRKAAQALVLRARRTASERLGVPPATDPETLTRLGADRTGLSPDDVARAIIPPEPVSDEDVIEIAVAVERLLAAFEPTPSQLPVGGS